ncbi:hypothetical protein SYK_15820 [Pseudodesulfovibrio nedwellii]|uniref:Glycosyltransferase RgtA/B/C/D-like domain-containing protein n=1 Tax=Pseudodesulfovibrio nedwellii TaxID=2973072 RepID=A0ABN6S505_9BACT|nr:hypothetical protein [Pseudodesulfovibrio nedwellii]BDQ37222.1 hypothetical protein SYK_15820 [Pseudodesulfovibrio nedwellii]
MQTIYKQITILIAVLVLVPILLVTHSMWDNDTVAMYFYTQDTVYLKEILTHGWYTAYALYFVLGKVFQLTGIFPRVFFSIITACSIVGLAHETFVYLQKQFELSKVAAWFGALIVLTFPLWHVTMASCMSISVMFIWTFMWAVNLRYKRPLISFILFVFSLNYYSLFSFAIGILAVEYIMTVTRQNVGRLTRNGFLYSIALTVYYLLITSFVEVHGETHDYNLLDVHSVIVAGIGYIAASVVILGGWMIWKRQTSSSDDANRIVRFLLSFITLFFFSIFAYVYVGRPLRFFQFGSFGGRHAILTCVPFAILFAISAEELLKRHATKTFHGVAAFILTAFIILLYQGYSHKAAALLFKEMLVSSLQAIESPESGFVSLLEDGYKAPRHVHIYSVALCFYRAYGKGEWMPNGFWKRRGYNYSLNDLKNIYHSEKVKKQMFAFEVTGDAFTKYRYKIDNYHQEGRFWYWYNYFFKDYSYFSPRLIKIE